MTDERRGLEVAQGMGNDIEAGNRGKVEKFAQAVASAVGCPESAKADVERLRATLESVLDGTIRLEYGWSSEAKTYHYWFVAKGRFSTMSYTSRIGSALAAREALAADRSA